jgi:hypothetical protein
MTALLRVRASGQNIRLDVTVDTRPRPFALDAIPEVPSDICHNLTEGRAELQGFCCTSYKSLDVVDGAAPPGPCAQTPPAGQLIPTKSPLAQQPRPVEGTY